MIKSLMVHVDLFVEGAYTACIRKRVIVSDVEVHVGHPFQPGVEQSEGKALA